MRYPHPNPSGAVLLREDFWGELLGRGVGARRQVMVTDRRTRQDFAACMRDLVHTYVRHYDRFGGSTGWPMHDLALPDFKPRQSTDALA